MYRYDPVAGVRCRRGSAYGKYFRYPSTAQESRQYYAYPGYVRPKRRHHRLPNAWDDIWRETVRHSRSWKLYRKTQYKERKAEDRRRRTEGERSMGATGKAENSEGLAR